METYGRCSFISGRSAHTSSGKKWRTEKLLALCPRIARSGLYGTWGDIFTPEAAATIRA
jgi:hypothetical protein